ncbi:hypothetical protein [Bacillus sp. ISL-37]|uniref:hypothetical protein n=1 Tax=Bacillus sp. ISL-37 TaxID=2819123 RepID=UPI001BE798A4|nr:hypothetical protein [Bacillus sp. ISL-37]MBT2682639.1 hypothetical protein [Bacillus sp. ISL-37]
MKKLVTVAYVFEGKSFPCENRRGVLLEDGKVFIADEEGVGIYAVQPSDEPETVIVNLDENDTNYLTDPAMIIDLIVA